MATRQPGAGAGARAAMVDGGRRRASHSLEAVISEAVVLLDEAGESALTFRALAARLGGGVASIYWYVSNKEELLDRATDHVLAGVLDDTEEFAAGSNASGGPNASADPNASGGPNASADPNASGGPNDDPIADLRAIAVALFDAIVDRPWLGAYLLRDTGTQPNGLLLYERLGQQVLRLGLTSRQSFHAVSAVLGFVVGTAADLGQQPPQEVLEGRVSRDQYLARAADQWRALDAETFPFVHHIVDEFAGHDDSEQFRAGLDLLLAGLRLEAGR